MVRLRLRVSLFADGLLTLDEATFPFSVGLQHVDLSLKVACFEDDHGFAVPAPQRVGQRRSRGE